MILAMNSLPQRPDRPVTSIEGAEVRIRPYRPEEAVRGADALSRPFHTGPDDVLAVADPATDRLVGGVEIIDQGDGEGRIGFWVVPESRRKGVATAAVRARTEHAFSTGYGRLQLRTAFENTAAQRVAIAAGYVREGVARAAAGPAGDRQDLIVWARTADDPPGPTPRFLPDLPDAELTDGRVSLRPMAASDAAEVHPVRASPEVVANTVTGLPPTAAETARYCARAGAAWLQDVSVRLTVRDAATGAFVGKVGLQLEDPGTGQAEIDYYLAPAWQGRGYATRAVNLLCDWAFTHTAIERLVAGVHLPNLASQQVLGRAGFVREGHERGRLPDGSGGRADIYTYALLRPA